MSEPCTARIKNDHFEEQCVLKAGHVDPEYGTDHAGPSHPIAGRTRWRDSSVGAVPHRSDRPTLEDLDADADTGPWCCTGNAEDCALCTDPNPDYPFICPGHKRTAANERIVGEAAQAAQAAEAVRSTWTQLEERAFNAVLPALHESGDWLPSSVRRAVATAVLGEVKRELAAFAAQHKGATDRTKEGRS